MYSSHFIFNYGRWYKNILRNQEICGRYEYDGIWKDLKGSGEISLDMEDLKISRDQQRDSYYFI